jgi:hypothetical protein
LFGDYALAVADKTFVDPSKAVTIGCGIYGKPAAPSCIRFFNYIFYAQYFTLFCINVIIQFEKHQQLEVSSR